MKKRPSSEFDNPKNRIQMREGYPEKGKIEAAAREMKHDQPSILKKTSDKKGKKHARKQAIAIMLSKARKK